MPASDRLRLGPGVRVVDRGRDRLQVGIRDGHSIVLPRTAATRRLLDALAGGGIDPGRVDPAAATAVASLRRTGLVAGRRERVTARVRVSGDVGVDPEPLLQSAGIGVDDRAGLALVLSRGEPRRELLDPLLRDAVPYLLVRVLDGAPVLGPLVSPGSTACLRCIDLHHNDEDPEYVAVLHRYIAACSPSAAIPPLDPVAATLVTSWAVHDLLTHASGRRPATWSATLAWDADISEMTATTWRPHPGCVCAWSGTIAS